MNALTQKPISPANIPVNAHTGANVLRGSTSATAQSALAAVVLMLLGSQAHASPASILCAQMGNLHGLACLGAQRSDDSASMSSGAPAPTLAGTTTWPVPAAMPSPPPPPAPPVANMQIAEFTSPGHFNWHVPAGITRIEVEVIGAANGSGHPGPGVRRVLAVNPGEAILVQVGQQGGHGGVPNRAGGSTWWAGGGTSWRGGWSHGGAAGAPAVAWGAAGGTSHAGGAGGAAGWGAGGGGGGAGWGGGGGGGGAATGAGVASGPGGGGGSFVQGTFGTIARCGAPAGAGAGWGGAAGAAGHHCHNPALNLNPSPNLHSSGHGVVIIRPR